MPSVHYPRQDQVLSHTNPSIAPLTTPRCSCHIFTTHLPSPIVRSKLPTVVPPAHRPTNLPPAVPAPMRAMITRRRKMKNQNASDCISGSVMYHGEMFEWRWWGANWQWRSERQETLGFISRSTLHTHKTNFLGYIINVCYWRGLESRVPMGFGCLSEKYTASVPKPLRFPSHSSLSDNHYLFFPLFDH